MKRDRDVSLCFTNTPRINPYLQSLFLYLSIPLPCVYPFLTLTCSLSLVETKAAAAVDADKIKHRLEQLDDMEEGGAQETLNLSQQDYVHKIDTMNKSLTNAWQRDQRVVALKISIQVCMSIWSCDIHYVYVLYIHLVM